MSSASPYSANSPQIPVKIRAICIGHRRICSETYAKRYGSYDDSVLNGDGTSFPLQSQCFGSIRSRSGGPYDPTALSNARRQLRCGFLGQRDRPLFSSLAKSGA